MDEEYEDLIIEFEISRARKEAAEKAFAAAQEKMIQKFSDDKVKTRSVGGKKFTVVRSERSTIDEEGLKKSLGAVLWKSVTVPKLDRSLLKEAIQKGVIDPIIVAQHSQVKYDRAFIRVSSGTEE